MDKNIANVETDSIQFIFDNFYMMRMELFLSNSRWEMLRSYVTPLERKQYDNAFRQISIENRFSYRNYERFAVYGQLWNRKERIRVGFPKPTG